MVCNTSAHIVDEITSNFQSLFTTSQPYNWEESLDGLQSSITNSMNQKLTRPVEDDEIKQALFSMDPHKAPGPNDMTPLFFQKCCHLIGNDICVAVRDFFWIFLHAKICKLYFNLPYS